MLITSVEGLGALARARRERIGWTQHDLAEKVNTTRQWISRFEKGSTDVTLERALAVLAALDLDVDVHRPGELTASVDPYSRIREQLRTIKVPAIDSEQSSRIAASIASNPAMKEAIERMSRLTFTVPDITVRAPELPRPVSTSDRETHA